METTTEALLRPEYIQGTPEWLEMRKKHITATDSRVIMGVDPWLTPYQLFEVKFGYRTIKENEAMREGKRIEPYARAKLQNLFGCELNPKVVFHPIIPWIMASLDCIDEKGKHLIEIKRSNKEDHQEAVYGRIPKKYFPQLQHQMFVAGVEQAYYYSVYNDKDDGVIVPLEFDYDYTMNMIAKEKEFYDRMINFDPPDMCEDDYVEHRDTAWYHQSQKVLSLQSQTEKIKKDYERERKVLIEMADGKNARGAGAKVTKIISKGRIDYDSIPQLQGLNLEFYRKEPITSWRISNE